MWLIVGQLPIKAAWRDAPFALWDFSQSNKYVRNFNLNWQFCFYELVKNTKSEYHHRILHIRISLGTKFQLKLTVLIFWTKFAQKRVFPIENRKSEQHHGILLIRISLGIKFHLKLTILIFWTKFAQKGQFQSKTKKVNSIIEFCIFELV